MNINSGGTVNAKYIEFYFNQGTITVNGGTLNTGSLVSWNTGYGTIALTDPSGGYALNLNASSSSQTFSGSISGTGSITKSGGSTQVFSGTDSFSGSVLVSGGELDFSQSNQFTHLNISNGAIVQFKPGATMPAGTPINLDGGSFIYGGGTNSIQNNITLTANGGTVAVTNSAATLTDINALTGTGKLTVVGPGTLSLAETGNSYTSLNISNGTLATINLPAISSLNLDGGTLAYSGASTTLAGPINISANSGTFNIFPVSTILTTTGALNASAATLTKTGTGTLDLALPGSYSVVALSIQGGTTQVSSGTLTGTSTGTSSPGIAVSNGAALVVSSGATVQATGFGFADVQIDGNSSALVTGTGSLLGANYEVNVGFTTPGMLTVSNGASVNAGEYLEVGGPYAGSSGGTGTMTINSGGTVTSVFVDLGYLSGSTGTVTVTGSGSTLNASFLLQLGAGSGVLNVSSGGTVNTSETSFYSNTSTINISGGTLNTGYLSSNSTGDGSITLSDPSGGVALNINGSGGTNTYSGKISGTGSLNKSGGSTQIFSGADTFTGSVLVSGGELDFEAGNSFTRLNISNGGTVQFGINGTIPVLTPIKLDGGEVIYTGNTFQGNPITLTANGGTISVPNAGTYLSESTAISGTGPLLITGPGTVFISEAGSTYSSLNVSNGTFSTISLPASAPITLDGGQLAYPGATASVAGGITVTANGGVFNVSSASTVLTASGILNGSTGTLTKVGAGTLNLALSTSSSNILFGLQLNGGLTQLTSGLLTLTDNSNDSEIGMSNNASLNISGGAHLNLSNTAYFTELDGGTITVSGAGSSLNNTIGFNIGIAQPGSLVVTQGASVSGSGSKMAIGAGTAGTLTINTAGSVSQAAVFLALDPGSSGNATVDGAGSTLTTPNLYIGGNAANGAGGTGTLVVSGGGSVNVSGRTFVDTAASSINISGGTLNTGSLGNPNGGGSVMLINPAGAFALNINGSAGTNTFSGIISGTGSLNKSGGSTQTLSGNNTFTGPVLVTGGTLTLGGTNQFTFANVSGGTLSLGSSGKLAAGANVTVYPGGTFTPSSNSTAIGTVNLSGGSLVVTQPNTFYVLNKIVTGTSGGLISDISVGFTTLQLANTGAGIIVAGNSTWTAAAAAFILNGISTSAPINISTGVTLTNGLGLISSNGNGFTILGGGTIYQNASPYLYVGAPVTVTQGTFRVTDATSADASGHAVGDLGEGPFTLNGGTFAYGGGTATATTPINITSAGGTIQIESSSATLTDTGVIISSGGLVKTGPGELIVPAFSATNLAINNGKLGLSGSGGVLKISTLTLNTLTTLDIGADAADISSGNLPAINLLVQQSYNGGYWNTSGITSTTAATDTKHLTAIGVIQNNQGGTAIYNSSHQFLNTAPGASDILIAYTYYGDANLSGKIDGSDYSRVDIAFVADRGANHFADTGWFNGDFNYDGTVNGSDYTLMDNAFNTQTAVLDAEIATPTAQLAGAGISAVPEPATLTLLGIGSLGVLSRRRVGKA